MNADFWHDVRESLRARRGKDLLVLGWTGAAGDQSPHLMYRKRAEERMRALRGLTRCKSSRGASSRPGTKRTKEPPRINTAMLCCIHRVATIELPPRLVSESRGRRGQVEGRDALEGPSQPSPGCLARRRREALRAAEGWRSSSRLRWSFTSSGLAT